MHVCVGVCALLTTSDLIAAVGAVPLSVTQVVSRDALAVLAGGLVRPAGARRGGGPRALLDGGGDGGRGGRGRTGAFII